MIALNGKTYRAVLDLDGRSVVIVERGRMWRVAPARDASMVLAGLRMPVLTVVR
jgi:hypothetical protein